MRTTTLIRLLALSLLLAASCNKTTKIRHEEPAGGTYTIAHLKSLCTSSSMLITGDITIQGTVVANDRFGELYKTLVIEDQSGGISIALDHTTIADLYPFGATVTVYCNGLTLCNYGGKIELGTTPEDNGAGRIASGDIARYVRRGADPKSPPEAKTLALAKIGFEHVDTYVCFEHVRFVESAAWCDLDPETLKPVTTERTLADGAGRTFVVRTLSTCKYAKETLPEGKVSIKGVIDYFAGKYTLHVVNRDFTQAD